MGYLYVYPESKENEKILLDTPEKLAEYSALVESFKKSVEKLEIVRKSPEDAQVCGLSQEELKHQYRIDSKGCSDIQYKDFLALLNSFRITAPSSSGLSGTGASGSGVSGTGGESAIYLEYNTGRKDFVAGRLLEDGKITAEEYKEVVV